MCAYKDSFLDAPHLNKSLVRLFKIKKKAKCTILLHTAAYIIKI